MDIKIYRQNRRGFMMRAVPGAVEVYIPHRFHKNHPKVKDFIAEGLRKLEGKIPEIPPEKTSMQTIREMIDSYAAKYNVKPTRIQFRDMQRKWGSCSSKGTVTLNTRLTWLEPELAEYIVCHELAHLLVLNHSKEFWLLMEKHMPDYAERRGQLQEIEKTLW
jgi:predicted metal-dependent hydrolase